MGDRCCWESPGTGLGALARVCECTCVSRSLSACVCPGVCTGARPPHAPWLTQAAASLPACPGEVIAIFSSLRSLASGALRASGSRCRAAWAGVRGSCHRAARPSWAPGSPGPHTLSPPLHSVYRLGSQAPVALRPKGCTPCALPEARAQWGGTSSRRELTYASLRTPPQGPPTTGLGVPALPPLGVIACGLPAPGPLCQQSAHCLPHSCPSLDQCRCRGRGC